MTIAKDVAQILFWIVIAVVSILTYVKARRTILQPIRTEIFKAQLELMRRVLGLFVGKDEVELRESYGFDQLLHANSVAMCDSYSRISFGVEIDSQKRPYGRANCPVSIVRTEDLRVISTDPFQKGEGEGETKRKVPKPNWKEYTHRHLHLPHAFLTLDLQIRELLENPLLPSRCVELLTAYRETAHQNCERLSDALTACAKKMPEMYPSIESLESASTSWIHNHYIKDFEKLKPKADAVVAFVRSLYDVDNLLNP